MRESELPGRPKKRGSGNSLAERKGEREKVHKAKTRFIRDEELLKVKIHFIVFCV